MSEPASISTPKRKLFDRFTAVDLVSIAVFALLLRFVFYYIYRALQIAFPLNQAIFPIALAFCIAACLVIVPKRGTILLFTALWLAIDFLFQGESPIYVAVYWIIPIVAEVMFVVLGWKGDERKAALIGMPVYIALHMILQWFALTYIFFVRIELPIYIPLYLLSVFVMAPIGGYFGHKVGTIARRVLG
jgi:hypothetical protein